MGNDGGSIPLRSELVKLKGAPQKVAETATANNEHAWKYCALSRAALSEPLASDALGRLYNKESIIRYILDNDAFGDVSHEIPHIKKMKDVVELKTSKSQDKFICEVTRRDMNGSSKFVYLTTCGHVFAAEALHTIETHECLICSKPYASIDIITLNPNESDRELLQTRLEGLEAAGLTHSGAPAKKEKKRKAGAIEDSKDRKSQRKTIAMPSTTKEQGPRSAVLNSLLHKTDDRIAPDGFMTRGTSSRVG
ncbi:Putative uncharacterized protein [Taphrina deformans PYCC 5710]|uniref:Uncharacterized protein n=1 Tax=Taphrina deformans (strain PYCC 5710 / ATCC 11124 / CBS 356.35 / IMI 108563 / JCM 9778 / NBRC 8474) TaxID=1097556 RepID=R5A392_TAPDE|nr:Putative uncharacterized protein [Taphrina deformans PYCC 5710]|eukprot:CCX35410.1 Putative uncharacterized protein [Taphrina deformans PYCC 5710]